MRRSTLNEQQKAVALLVSLGQFSYRQIAKQAGVNRNSVTNWLKNAQVLALVEKFQADIEGKMEEGALASVTHRNTLLLNKALKKLEDMLNSRSQRKQLQVVKFLLESGALAGVRDAIRDDPQEGQPSRIRLDPEIVACMKAKQF